MDELSGATIDHVHPSGLNRRPFDWLPSIQGETLANKPLLDRHQSQSRRSVDRAHLSLSRHRVCAGGDQAALGRRAHHAGHRAAGQPRQNMARARSGRRSQPTPDALAGHGLHRHLRTECVRSAPARHSLRSARNRQPVGDSAPLAFGRLFGRGCARLHGDARLRLRLRCALLRAARRLHHGRPSLLADLDRSPSGPQLASRTRSAWPLALALGLSSNYYGILAFFPIAIGETVLTIRTRRIYPATWLALAAAALPLLAYLPLIHHNIAEFTPHAWNRPRLDMLSDSYLILFEGILWPVLGFALYLASWKGPQIIRTQPTLPPSRLKPPVQPHELSALASSSSSIRCWASVSRQGAPGWSAHAASCRSAAVSVSPPRSSLAGHPAAGARRPPSVKRRAVLGGGARVRLRSPAGTAAQCVSGTSRRGSARFSRGPADRSHRLALCPAACLLFAQRDARPHRVPH